MLLGLTTLLFNVVLFALGFPLRTIDGRLFYEPREIGALLWKLGDAGRARYLLVARLDLLFIPLYTSFFVLLARHWAKSRMGLLVVCFLAATMALFDYGETLGVRYLLELFPAADKPVELLVSRCTPLKWSALFGVGIALVALWRARGAGAGAGSGAGAGAGSGA